MSEFTAITAQTWVKAPEEIRHYGMDFTSLLASGEVLAGVTSVTYTVESGAGGTVEDLTLGSPTFSNGTQIATVQISGGNPGVTYRVTYLVTTTGDNTLRCDGLLDVEAK